MSKMQNILYINQTKISIKRKAIASYTTFFLRCFGTAGTRLGQSSDGTMK